MTPEEIDRLTIAEVRAIAERAGDALKTLRELGLVTPQTPAELARAARASNASPFPCPACGRVAVERPNEPTQDAECLTCRNHLPLEGGVRVSNKGPLVMDAEMRAKRAALISAPAFDATGEPTP